MGFFSDYLADARIASAQTGFLVSVILAQWADETTYGASKAFVQQNNFAGVSVGGGVNTFKSKDDGLAAYVETANLGFYDPVRAAKSQGAQAQAIALGKSPWAAAHYNGAAYKAGARCPGPSCGTLLANAGVDLVSIINSNKLTQYDGQSLIQPAPITIASAFPASPAGAQISTPPLGITSDIAVGQFTINGSQMDEDVTDALVTAELLLSMSQASTFTLTLHDPNDELIALPIFNQKSTVNFGSTALSFSLVSIEPQDSVLTVAFEAFIVAALRTATGPITSGAGQMTRTAFAILLIQQVQGAGVMTAPDSYLRTLQSGYTGPTREQISRGTKDNPLEDSWTCLQRLAAEIGWVCFECFGTVYFGPYSWLALQPPVLTPIKGVGGIDSVNGTYDIGQINGTLEVKAAAGAWIGQTGDAISITKKGPFNGIWLVSEIERGDVEEPDITITLIQPQPSLPEPTNGGATAAVGAGLPTDTSGAQQSAGGSTAAKQALTYAQKQIGKPYIWGGENPATGFDCSGLMQAAYLSAGIQITRSTYTQWQAGLPKVPVGIGNLRPGDLVYFGGSDAIGVFPTGLPGHVGIVSTVNKGTNVVTLIDAFSSGHPIRYDTFVYVSPGGRTAFAGIFWGALRPAP